MRVESAWQSAQPRQKAPAFCCALIWQPIPRLLHDLSLVRIDERAPSPGLDQSQTGNEDRFRLLVESVKDYAIFMLDPHGLVATWNTGAERIKGYSAERIVGQHFSRFYPEEDVRAGKCEFELEIAAQQGRFEDEGWRVRENGSRFWANVVITALRAADGELVGFAKVTRDLTERQRAAEARLLLAEQAAARLFAERVVLLLERLHAVTGAVSAATTPEQIASTLVEHGARALHAIAAACLLIDDGKLRVAAQQGQAETLAKVGAHDSAGQPTPITDAVRTRSSQWLASAVDVHRRYPALPALDPGESVAILPLVAGERVVGVLALVFRDRVYATEERALLDSLAAHTAQAVERAEGYQREAQARVRLERLNALSRALSLAFSTEDVGRAVVAEGVSATGADACTLYVLDEATRELVLTAHRGHRPEAVERVSRVSEAIDDEALWVESTEQEGAPSGSVAGIDASGTRVRAFWKVPLVAEGRLVGLLAMGFHQSQHFAPSEREFVLTIASQCAGALLRTRRVEFEREARALAEKVQAFLSTTLRSIADAVIATGATNAVVMMNPIAETLTGFSEAEALGRPLHEVFRVSGPENQAVLTGPRGREIPIDHSTAPIRRAGGVTEGAVIVFRDVTNERREHARRALLADATVLLAESFDYEQTLKKALNLAVPVLADWCAIDLVQEGGERKRVALAHVDPAKVAMAESLYEKYPPQPDAAHGVPNVLRTGRAELYREIDDELLAKASVDDEHLRIMREVGMRSAMVVPMFANERIFGALSFISTQASRAYAEEDLLFAQELARRCAIAIEGAKRYASEQQARQSAEVANRAKDEFLAIVSHELRTPLNAILGWAKMMSGPHLDATQRARGIDTIERNSVTMAQLIEDLLDMSRVISGKMHLELQRLELAGIVETAVEAVRLAAEAKGITVRRTLQAALPLVLADPTRVQQIVWNLLTNAVKFTPQCGLVEVSLSSSDGWVELAVQDSGRGIEPRFLPYVFEPFRQQDASYRRVHGGLGLGLAISKQLVELQGGRIAATSAGAGRGATFTVRLPAMVEQTSAAAARIGEKAVTRGFSQPSQLQGLKVLVVDDEPDSRDLVKTVLDGCGSSVTVAAGVEEALAAFERQVPDVLLSDVGMPERDGYDLIQAVRSFPSERGGDVPAAALTAFARGEDRRKLLQAGYSMHLAKPIDPDELVAVVASLTRLVRRSDLSD
jgi:PAS domain S-box-containing protein